MGHEEITLLFTGYEKEYYTKYHDTIPYKWGGVKEKDREAVYKKALEEGKTWQQVTGYAYNKEVLL